MYYYEINFDSNMCIVFEIEYELRYHILYKKSNGTITSFINK